MPLNKSGRITLGQIYNEFLPQTNTAKHSISEYYRRGANVPDIFENKNIPIHEPTAALRGRVNWSDYYGTSAVVNAYTTALPAINEDDFWRHCEGSPNYWSAVQDNWKQYVTRKDGAYCVMLEVRTPYARINVQPAQTRLGTELGEDSGYEKLLRNTNLNTDYFPFGEWTMTVPRKITRFRIVATAGGGSGSVQKITASDSALKGQLTPIIEDGHDGGDVTITANDLTVRLLGGLGGGKSIRLSGNDKNYDPNRVQVTGPAAVSTNKLFKYADSPQTRNVYGITNAATAGESTAFLPVTFPARHKKQSTGANEMDWFAGSDYPINLVWWEDSPENSLYGQANSAAGGSGRGGSSIWSDGYPAAAEHPNQGEPTEPNSTDWGTGGAAGQHAQRGAVTYGGDAAETAYLGDFETAPGEEITIKVPEGGVQSINLYTDYNQVDKDNFTPSQADQDQYADHPVYGTGFYVGSSYVSKSGKGGEGMVQIFGATGRAYSEMSHAGTVLLDEDYNIIQQKFSSATSLKGVDNYNPSFTMPYTVDVIGTEDPTVPKIFYIAYTGRIRKNGLLESRTHFKSDGCAVSVTPVTENHVSIAPSNASGSISNLEAWLASAAFGTAYPASNLRKKLYVEPEITSDEPIVSGKRGNNSDDDFEDVGNVFADACAITFDVTNYGTGPRPKMKFQKTNTSNMGIGPKTVDFKTDGTVEYTPDGSSTPIVGNTISIGVGEEYLCSKDTGGMTVAAPKNTAVSYPTSSKTNYLLSRTSYTPWTLAAAKDALGEGKVDEFDTEVSFSYDLIGGGHGGRGKGHIGGDQAPDTSVDVSYDIVGGGYGGWGFGRSAGETSGFFGDGSGGLSEPIVFRNPHVSDYWIHWEIGGGRISELFPDLVDADGYVRITDDWQTTGGSNHWSGECAFNNTPTRFPEFFYENTFTWMSGENDDEENSCLSYNLKPNWKDIARSLARLQAPSVLSVTRLGGVGLAGGPTVLTNRTTGNEIADTGVANSSVSFVPDTFNPTFTSTTNIVARPQNWNGNSYGNGGRSYGFLRKELIGGNGPSSNPLVFGTTGHPIDGSTLWPHTWWRDWTISGGRIKELFGSETVRLGENYMNLGMFHRLGKYITLSEFLGGGTMGPDPYDPDGTAPYVGNFPELYEKIYWMYRTGRDDEETHVRSNWRLKSNWKEIAENLYGQLYDTPYYFPPGSTAEGYDGTGEDVGANGLTKTGNITMQVGDVIDFQIGYGGLAGNFDTTGVVGYPTDPQAADGESGAVIIQGVLYTESGSHTVFAENAVEVDYDMVGGGSGGHGLGVSSWGSPEDGYVPDYPGSPGGGGGETILTLDSITGTQLANTGVAPNNLVQRKLNWNGETYGNGGTSWGYRHRNQGGSPGYWKPAGATPEGAGGTGIDVGHNGLTASGTVSLQVGQTIHITIGQGGSGGAFYSGIHYGNGGHGSNGAVLIQGVLYTEDAVHTVTAGTSIFHYPASSGTPGGSTILSKKVTQPLTTLLETLTWSAGDATVTSSPIAFSDYTTLIIKYTNVVSNASVTTFEMRKPTGHITPRNYNSGEGVLPMNGTQTITTSTGSSTSVINLNGTDVTTTHSKAIGEDNDPITFGWTAGAFAAGGSIEISGTSATQTIVGSTQIASTTILDACEFNDGVSQRGWNGGVQGDGGKNSEYYIDNNGVFELVNEAYARPGGEIYTSHITANIGDVFDFVIGEGGIGSNDADPNSNQKAQDGKSGGIIIQGVLYTESGSHVVTGVPVPIEPDDNLDRLIRITSSGGKWWTGPDAGTGGTQVTWFSCSVETPADGESLGTAFNRAAPVLVVTTPVTTTPTTTKSDSGNDNSPSWTTGVDQFGNVTSGWSNADNGWITDPNGMGYSEAVKFSKDGEDLWVNKEDEDDDEDDDGGWCFLTTAIVEIRGEADDGETLNILRKFRDNFLLQNYPNEIEEYYRIAPQLVNAIPKTNLVWGWIGEQIDLSISYINRQENENAYSTYKNMVKVLENDWLIKKE